MNTNTQTKRKRTILDSAPEMSRKEINDEVDKRIVAIQSGKIEGEKLKNLMLEAAHLARMYLRRSR